MCYANSELALSQCSNCSDDGSRSGHQRSAFLREVAPLPLAEGAAGAAAAGEKWPGGTGDYTCSGDLVANGTRFPLKNLHFLLRNLHFLLRNLHFLLENVNFLLKNVDFIIIRDAGRLRLLLPEERHRALVCALRNLEFRLINVDFTLKNVGFTMKMVIFDENVDFIMKIGTRSTRKTTNHTREFTNHHFQSKACGFSSSQCDLWVSFDGYGCDDQWQAGVPSAVEKGRHERRSMRLQV